MVTSKRILLVALVTQSTLVILAWWAARLLDIPPQWGQPARDTVIGLAVAVTLAVANFLMLTRAPANWVTNGVRDVYHSTIVPLFGALKPAGVVAIGAAAGIGEEWLFRGVLQPLLGLLAASVLFGAAHVGGLRMLPFGVWATGMGLVMGALAAWTGGLIAPIVAHAVYDMLALEYIRRGAQNK